MSDRSLVAGSAALTICETLMLFLNERGLMDDADCIGVLEDAATAHEADTSDPSTQEFHADVAVLIRGIIAGGNSVRRS